MEKFNHNESMAQRNIWDYSSGLMPAEWHNHAATWCAFPFNEENWPGILKEVREEYAQLVYTIAQFEPVHLFVNDDSDSLTVAQNYFHAHANVHIHKIQLNDVWYRDNGPLFVKNNHNQIIPIKWQFNAWGKKYPYEKDNLVPFKTFEILNCQHVNVDIVLEGGAIEVNGAGIALTTRQCLLNKNRNPNLTQEQIEGYLEKYLGIKKCIWLQDGLQDDHTDGHIDTIVRFIGENKILCSFCENDTDPNFAIMQNNLEILKRENEKNQFEIIMLPLPKNKMFLGNKRLACTYANFYMSSKFVIVPMYADPNDEKALNIFKSLFPNHKVFGLSSKYIIHGGGSFHCLTQQQPEGTMAV